MKAPDPVRIARERLIKEKEKPSVQKEPVVSSSLVKPGDITDAVDSRDLLDTLLSQNIERVRDKNLERQRVEWVIKKKGEIQQSYTDRAEAAYNKIWATCRTSKVGHDFRQLDIRGVNVMVCEDCSFAKSAYSRPEDNGGGYVSHSYYDELHYFNASDGKAQEMNRSIIKALANKMIEVDEQAGKLEWPKEEDMPVLSDSSPFNGKKKSGWWGK